eukprot:TRINITY_DN28389_c0_g2_i2.p1 TRINITY_DN28389_c0_g2~~TRINITY_DN28389_c0_g2_i2.p1  ORF type:complete len:145 (+),score=21.35 TRINITY_DN28389_c0_g2_i2:263-697(+)
MEKSGSFFFFFLVKKSGSLITKRNRKSRSLTNSLFFRTKLKQTEVDCEFLKRCCENLTEENRRLQKEVQELRALKLSPQFYMHMTPPTTLTMCPSCERVALSSHATNTTTPKTSSIPIPPWAAAASAASAPPPPIRAFDTPSRR